ncbi:MAG: integrase [Desulfobacteraceae bacterium]|nr:MAG: integrase [Desulfobacteraceae bacterium]
MRLGAMITDYIAYRKALGERFHTNAKILNSFARAIDGGTELAEIKPNQVNNFLNGTGPITASWHVRYNALLGFYRYALSRGLVMTSPLPAVRPRRPQPFVPYIYTHEELRRLMAAALTYQKNRGLLEPYMVQTLLLLLYGTGLRPSEALRLSLADVDLAEALITIRDSKFFTSRLVPTGASLNQNLLRYAAHRHQAGYPQNDTSPFFVKRNGQRISISNIDKAFQRIRQEARVSRVDGARYQPRLHDLRHTYAVHRLTSWYQEGKDVQRLLPQLSTYLGHRYLAATSVYLTMTPELLNQASQRFEIYALKGGLP